MGRFHPWHLSFIQDGPAFVTDEPLDAFTFLPPSRSQNIRNLNILLHILHSIHYYFFPPSPRKRVRELKFI